MSRWHPAVESRRARPDAAWAGPGLRGSLLAAVLRAVQGLPTVLVTALALLTIIMVALVSLRLPPGLGLGMLYAIPVALGAAVSSRFGAAALAIFASATWTVAQLLRGAEEGVMALGNAGLRLLGLAVMVVLVHSFIDLLHHAAALSSLDELTGLANRRGLFERARAEIARMCRTGSPLSVAYLDIDAFKQINDVYGHGAGDKVLRQLAAILRTRSRASDLAARLGGDEFFLLLADTDITGAAAFVSALQGEIDAKLRVRQQPVTVSVGLATVRRPPDSVEELLLLADEAMYRAKGRERER